MYTTTMIITIDTDKGELSTEDETQMTIGENVAKLLEAQEILDEYVDAAMRVVTNERDLGDVEITLGKKEIGTKPIPYEQ